MPETRKRDAMPDIISAKCFGCGHIIRIPAALGGKKAKCPQCANVIVIPMPHAGGEFVPDADLPEVARDGDILEGDEIEEGEEIPSPARAESPRPSRGVAGRRGAKGRGGYASARKKSSPVPLIAGGVGALVLVIVLIVAMNQGPSRGTRGAGGAPEEVEKVPPGSNEAKVALWDRCLQYTQVFNRRDLLDIMKFYTYGQPEEIRVKGMITGLLERGTRYDDVTQSSIQVDGDGGSVTFGHSGGQKTTLNWRKVGDSWLIVP